MIYWLKQRTNATTVLMIVKVSIGNIKKFRKLRVILFVCQFFGWYQSISIKYQQNGCFACNLYKVRKHCSPRNSILENNK